LRYLLRKKYLFLNYGKKSKGDLLFFD
jgi:hypothetical protein